MMLLKVKPSLVELAIRMPSTAVAQRSMSMAEFEAFCAANPELRTERTAQGEVIIMAPAGTNTGRRNSVIGFELALWAKQDGRGIAFDSSAGFMLPNGAIRSPDASWLLRDKWEALTPKQRARFAPVCPDFVLELRSPTDTLAELQAKMAEYLAQGVALAWLVDPVAKQVLVYRPEMPVVVWDGEGDGNTAVVATPPLDGFILPLQEIFAD
jgi:Uma2 family endonuclease